MQTENHFLNQSKPNLVNIATFLRLRPLLPSESDLKESVSCRDEKSIEINLSGQIRKQNLEKVFSTSSTQRQVFDAIQPILQKCISGYNVTIFTYGQTGSGKTHTMFGSDWDNIIKKTAGTEFCQSKQTPQQTFLRSIQQDENHSGLIPRTINHVFGTLINARRKYIKVYCSFLQLYNQSMLDLLEDDFKKAKEKKMYIHQNQKDGIYIEGLNQVLVQSADECLQLMKKGEKNRTVRQTHMNVKSSRSHSIFQLLIEEIFPAKKSYRRMKLNLCDLAGSEKINKSERMNNEHLEELKNINLSLTTLGKVISCLSEQRKPPYRESKLTRLLQDSLGGNTFTVIIATITTKSICLDESLNTLKFLERAKQIKTEVISKIHSNDNSQMSKLQKEIAYLKDVLKIKRNGVSVIDTDLNQKYKKLQQQNNRLKEMVDQELVQKLKRENVQLKLKLQRKNNDELSQSFMRSGDTFSYGTAKKERFDSEQNYTTKEHKTIEETGSRGELTSHKDEVYSQFRVSSQDLARKINLGKKNLTYGRSTGASSLSGNPITRNSQFPSLGKKLATNSTNKILERIQQIEKVKQINKLKLEQELEMMNSNKISLDSKSTFARVSKYSNKYRY